MFEFITNFFKTKEEKIIIDSVIDNMSIHEYNQYIFNQKEHNRLCVIKKLECILDYAYDDYIKKCKQNKSYILDLFFIMPGEYGITKDDICAFYMEECHIKDKYLVSYCSNRYTDDWLKIKIINQ